MKALKILHNAFMIGLVLFAGVIYFLVYSGNAASIQELDKSFQVIAIILCAAGLYFSNTLFNKAIERIKNSTDTVPQKINLYRGAIIVKWALLEGPAILTIVAFFLTANNAFIILAGIMICALYIAGPSKQRIMQQLQLDEVDAEQF
ncbi:MAG: hypothetical protein ABI091_08140 [Ferruginibacter sp.]